MKFVREVLRVCEFWTFLLLVKVWTVYGKVLIWKEFPVDGCDCYVIILKDIYSWYVVYYYNYVYTSFELSPTAIVCNHKRFCFVDLFWNYSVYWTVGVILQRVNWNLVGWTIFMITIYLVLTFMCLCWAKWKCYNFRIDILCFHFT